MIGYYDIILGLIPVSLVGVTALFAAVGMSLSIAVPIAAAVSIGLIVHGMFVNGPVTSGGTERSFERTANGGIGLE